MKQWLPYVDDLPIRTGRVLDRVVHRDDEMTARVRAAVELSNMCRNSKSAKPLRLAGLLSKGWVLRQAGRRMFDCPRLHLPQTDRNWGNQGVEGAEAEKGFKAGLTGEPAVVGGVVLACWEVRGFGNSHAAVSRSVSSSIPGRSRGSPSEGAWQRTDAIAPGARK